MMKKIFFMAAAACGMLAVTGCSDEHVYDLGGEGSVALTASFSNDVITASRADLATELAESAIVWISKSNGDGKDGLVRKYEGLNNVPDQVLLPGGSYVAELWAGDSVPASFDKKYYKAVTPFTITANNTTAVNMVGRIANTVASVKYDAGVADVLTDCKMTIGHERASLTFDDPANQRGYFMMPNTDNDKNPIEHHNLTWTLTGKKVSDGSTYTRTGVIEDVKPTTEYILNVKYTAQTEAVGGGMLDIVVDESEIAVDDNLVITLAPVIMGYHFDFAQGLSANEGQLGRRSVYISAAAALTRVVIAGDILRNAAGFRDIDILSADNESLQDLIDAGINWEFFTPANMLSVKINLEAELLNSLTLGEYPLVFTATDANGQTSTATLNISINEAKVVAIEPASADITRTSAVLAATLIAEDALNYGFEYREAQLSRAGGEWTFVKADRLEGQTYYVTISGLTPGRTYEYRAVCDNYVSEEIVTFNAAAGPQLPNCGFEDWQTSSSPYLLYGAGQSMFWDSGNHGSSTMNKNVTVPDASLRHSGNYSVKLCSQFVGVGSLGKFAAGNAFVGKYIATEGTDGILGFGQPFDFEGFKPRAIRFWVKYTPGEIKYIGKDFPEYNDKKGQMDQGSLYVALLDETLESVTYSGNTYTAPIIIRTKKGENRKLFNPDAPNIIAYAYKIFDKATDGNGLVMMEIPFEYRSDKTPAAVMCTFAASLYGDYFTGGDSTMWVDDVELVY